MKRLPSEIRLPKLRMEASFEPSTLDAEKRTVEIRWYTGAKVERFSMFDGPYHLSFDMDPKAVRMDRLSSGRAVFKRGHADNSDLSAVLGVIERAWLAADGGHAIVRMSKRADVDPILVDIADGILRNVSMEAAIHAARDVTEKGDEFPHLLAIDWEPRAVALVAVGADADAQALGDEAAAVPCKVTRAEAPAEAPNGATAPTKGKSMKIQVRLLADDSIIEIEEAEFDEKLHSKELQAKKLAPVVSLDAERAEKLAMQEKLDADKRRAERIKEVQTHYQLDANWSRFHIDNNTSIEKVIELAAEERAKRSAKIRPDLASGDDRETDGWRFDRMVEALTARALRKDVPEAARQYAHLTLVEAAFERLAARGLHRGLDVRAHSARVVELALTSTDYPNLLANAANKILLGDYMAQEPTYRRLAERQDLPDFKTASVLKAGDFPIPLQVGESGEVKLGAFSEAKDTFALATYGRRILFAFQAIINDDLGAFVRIMRSFAKRLADFENGLFFSLLTSASGAGPTLGDGGALFNATAVTTAGGHANLTSSGTAISVDSIGVGRAAMRKQVSLDGIKLNIPARHIVVSPDKETLARQYTTLLGPNLAAASQNPWAGMLEPLVDANLSGNPWYLFADPAVAPVAVYGYLQGQPGPDVSTRQGFEVLGVEMRVALHFGVAFIDFRGAYRNAGA